MEGKDDKYIRIGGRPIRVTQDVYEAFYKMRRQEKTLEEKDARNRLVYYDAWDNGVTSGRDVLPDKAAPPLEDIVITAITRDKLYRCLNLLSEEERDLIRAIFFEGETIQTLSRSLNIPYRTLGYRRDRALKKLRRMLEKQQ